MAATLAATENPPTAVRAAIEEHLEKHRKVPGRRCSPAVIPGQARRTRGNRSPDAAGSRLGCRAFPARDRRVGSRNSGGKHEVAVVHAERFEQTRRSDELPEGLTAHAANDVAQQLIAEIRIEHRRAWAARQRRTGGETDPRVERRVLARRRGRRQFGRSLGGRLDERTQFQIVDPGGVAEQVARRGLRQAIARPARPAPGCSR